MADEREYKRLTIDLPPELHQRLKMLSVRRGVSMREMIEEWIRVGMKADRGADRTDSG